MTAATLVATGALLLLLVFLIYLLLKHTHAKQLFRRLLGWVELEEEKSILDRDDFIQQQQLRAAAAKAANASLSPNASEYQLSDEIGKKTSLVLDSPLRAVQQPSPEPRLAGLEQLYYNAETLRMGEERSSLALSANASPNHVAGTLLSSSSNDVRDGSPSLLNRKRSSLTSEDEFLEKMDESGVARLNRALSTESLDSTCSAFDLCRADQDHLGRLELRVFYDRASQLFHLWVLQAYDLRGTCSSPAALDFWIVVFLLPHPKPLWRTQLRTGSANPVQFHEEYQQCVRPKDMNKVVLLCQLYSRETSGQGRTTQDVSLMGQCRVRLKDISLDQPNTVWLSFLPSAQEDDLKSIGEVLFSVSYMPIGERLTVVISKIRQLNGGEDHEFDHAISKVLVRVYMVQGVKVSKKKTSVKPLVEGTCTYNESMIFNLPQANFDKVYLRISVVEPLANGEQRSLGHVTIGSRRSGKELGHWQKISEQPRKPIAMWHSIMPKK
uniref:C2 domain-containing protein n=2 Tax=Plectus sambesii TaxID=2011161 RepID=A0A914WCQ4_9BILA